MVAQWIVFVFLFFFFWGGEENLVSSQKIIHLTEVKVQFVLGGGFFAPIGKNKRIIGKEISNWPYVGMKLRCTNFSSKEFLIISRC